jgi:hypothetical protein
MMATHLAWCQRWGIRLHQLALDFDVVARRILNELEKLVKGTESRAAGKRKNLGIPPIIRHVLVQNLVLKLHETSNDKKCSN